MNVLNKIKMCKPLLTFVMLAMLALPLCAAFIQPEQALRVADVWMRTKTDNSTADRTEPMLKSFVNNSFSNSPAIYDMQKAGLPLLYLAEYADGSFVLVSADNNALPVLGYNDVPQARKSTYPPAFIEWADFYAQQINEIRNSGITMEAYQQQWTALLGGENSLAYRTERAVQPLMTTNWDQGWPYNELCPVDSEGPGGHVYAGCVATAMAMVMKYWNHPTTGVGNGSYYAMGYGYQSANFGATTYLWDEMPDALGSSNIPVATLLYHLGVSVNMMYAPDGSGAQSYDAADALVDHFRYPQAQYVDRSSYSLANWNALLKDQIDNGSPIYYSGHGAGGGHAFVIDGYDTADYFHFNFGWSGSSNGYYYVTNINPSGDFNQSQAAIINTIPENYSIANTKVRMHAANATVGDYFLLRLNTNPILGTWNVNHYEFNLHYDHNFLNFNGADIAGTISSAGSVNVTNPEPGVLAVSWNGPSRLIGGGNLINFSFTPVDQGEFLFDLSDMKYNNSTVNNTMYLMVNAQAPVATLAASQITMQNVMHLGYQQIGTTEIRTTYLLPSWQVNHYQFNVNYDSSKLDFTGITTDGTMSSELTPTVVVNSPGSVSLSCDADTYLEGVGVLLKLNFMAIGNTSSLSVTQVSLQGFYYNTTQITSLGGANFILSAYVSVEDEVVQAAPIMRIAPNPINSHAEFILESKSEMPAVVNIYNLKGQMVRELKLGNPGKSFTWDTNDASGRKLSTGIYFLTWKQGMASGKSKMLILR